MMRLFVSVSELPQTQTSLTTQELRQAFVTQELGRHLHVTTANAATMLAFDYGAYGKPRLRHYPDWQFNLSHSKRHLALVVAQTQCELGIDIESHPRTIRPAVLTASLHPREWDVWHTMATPQQAQRYWLKTWTIKEAVLKAAGLGIQTLPNQFDSLAHPHTQGGQLVCANDDYQYRCVQHAHWQLAIAWQGQQTAEIQCSTLPLLQP